MIQRCAEEDLLEVLEIEKLSFAHPYPLFVFKRYLRTYFFISEKDDRITGYVIGIKMGVKGVIISIAVHPSHRMKGIGSALIRHIVKEMNVPILEVQVRRSNAVAQKFYISLGFKKKEVIPCYYSNNEDAFIMVKSSELM